MVSVRRVHDRNKQSLPARVAGVAGGVQVVVESGPPADESSRCASVAGPLETTPLAALVDLPRGDRYVSTVPRRAPRVSHHVVGIGAFVLTLTLALASSMTWLSLRTRVRSTAAAGPSKAALGIAPDVTAPPEALPLGSASSSASARLLPRPSL